MSNVTLQKYRTAHEELVFEIISPDTEGYVFDPETGEHVLPLPDKTGFPCEDYNSFEECWVAGECARCPDYYNCIRDGNGNLIPIEDPYEDWCEVPFEGNFPDDDSCNFADDFPDTETADEFGERMLELYP